MSRYNTPTSSPSRRPQKNSIKQGQSNSFFSEGDDEEYDQVLPEDELEGEIENHENYDHTNDPQEQENHFGNTHKSNSKTKQPVKTNANPGLRLLDACFDDVGYARYLLDSKLPGDRAIKTKVNWRDQQTGVSILHLLVYSELEAAVNLLIAYKADVNIRNKNEETPLHWCAKMNSMKTAKILIDNHAKINLVDNSGSTPLHYAASMGNLEMVVLLLDRGADVTIQDHEHLTAIELASEGKSNASKAIMIAFLRFYQKQSIPIPKTVSTKVGFTPLLSEGINMQLIEAPVKPSAESALAIAAVASGHVKPTNQTTNSHAEGITVTNQGATSPTAQQLSSSGGAQFPVTQEMLQQFYQQQANLQQLQPQQPQQQPLTIYDQIRANKLEAGGRSRRSFMGNINLPVDDSDSNSNVMGMSQDNLPVKNPAPTRKYSIVGLNNAAAMAILSNNNSPPKKQQQPPPQPKFAVRKVEYNDISLGSSSPPPATNPLERGETSKSLKALINNMDDGPSDPSSLRRGSSVRGRFISRSMSAVAGMSNVGGKIANLEDFVAKLAQQQQQLQQLAILQEQKKQLQQQQTEPLASPGDVGKRGTAAGSGMRATFRRGLSAPDISLPMGTGSSFYRNGHELENSIEEEPTNTAQHSSPTHHHHTAQQTQRNLLTTTVNGQDPALDPTALLASNVLRPTNFVELAYPPAEVLPLLPSITVNNLISNRISQNGLVGKYAADHLDVIIAVEHCADCHLHNDQSLRHNVVKYVQNANATLYALIKAIVNARLGVRLYALRTKPLSKTRIGAFEVTIAMRVNMPVLAATAPVVVEVAKPNKYGMYGGGFGGYHPPQPVAAPPQPVEQPKDITKWATHRLFSKLETKSWPNIKTLEQKAVNFIEVTMKDLLYGKAAAAAAINNATAAASNSNHTNHNSSSNALQEASIASTGEYVFPDGYNDYKYSTNNISQALVKDVQSQYAEWIERMKIPPQIVRDPLDIDLPTDLLNLNQNNAPIDLLNGYMNGNNSSGSFNNPDSIKHPKGPFIDISLASQLSKEQFERCVLEHFFVFDSRIYPKVKEQQELEERLEQERQEKLEKLEREHQQQLEKQEHEAAAAEGSHGNNGHATHSHGKDTNHAGHNKDSHQNHHSAHGAHNTSPNHVAAGHKHHANHSTGHSSHKH